MIPLVLLAIGCAAVAVWIVVSSRRPPLHWKVLTPIQPIDESAEVGLLRVKLERAPCSAAVINKLVSALFKDEHPAEVITVSRQWMAMCGPHSTLPWRIFTAHKMLGEWLEAAEVVSEILAEDPADSDYWWWRGEVQEQLHKDAAALADYRQSMANSESGDAGAWSAGRILAPAQRSGRACEAVGALSYFERDLGGELSMAERDQRTNLARDAGCTSRIRGRRGPGGDEVRVQVGRVGATFLVQPYAGTTVLSRDLAARAGIETSSARGETFASGQIQAGAIAIVPKLAAGGASVEQLDVIVVDTLPPGVDGVLGLNFLWWFDPAR